MQVTMTDREPLLGSPPDERLKTDPQAYHTKGSPLSEPQVLGSDAILSAQGHAAEMERSFSALGLPSHAPHSGSKAERL